MKNALLADKHILIVEDDEPCRLFLEIILNDAGCSFEVAVNGREAVERVKVGGYDIVLMDVRMPVLNGYEAAQAIRLVNKNLPVIAVTAHAIEGVKEKCVAHGMNDYLTKPFTQEKLLEKLVQWTSGSARAGE